MEQSNYLLGCLLATEESIKAGEKVEVKRDENSRPVEKDVMLLDLQATEKQQSSKR